MGIDDDRSVELASQIGATAQCRLDEEGLDASVIQVAALEDGFQIFMVVPKRHWEADADWQARVQAASKLLSVIEGVSAVHLEITKMGSH